MNRRLRWILIATTSLILIAGGAATGLLLNSDASAPPGEDPEEERRDEAPPSRRSGSDVSGVRSAPVASRPAGSDGKQEKKAVPVSVAPIRTASISAYLTSTANLVAENEVKVLAESEGRIVDLLVEEGDRVARGQALATLVREEAQIALKKAQLRATNARIGHERAERLAAQSLVSQEEYDRLSLEKDVAQQELAEARWKLEKKTIRAPFSGRITDRAGRLGQHVNPDEPLFTVTDFELLIARVYLPEKDVIGLEEGRGVRITLKANPLTVFAGRIRQISPVVDTATGTVKVTIEAVKPPAGIRPGAFVSIDIERERRSRATVVPREAIIRELQQVYVFVARDGVAERRPVTLGLEDGGRIEVLSGLSPGELVITSGHGALKDGSPVKVVPGAAARDRSSLKSHSIRGG